MKSAMAFTINAKRNFSISNSKNNILERLGGGGGANRFLYLLRIYANDAYMLRRCYMIRVYEAFNKNTFIPLCIETYTDYIIFFLRAKNCFLRFTAFCLDSSFYGINVWNSYIFGRSAVYLQFPYVLRACLESFG